MATGYNGKPAGSINDAICCREGPPDNAAKPNCCIHSELNASIHSAPGERLGATMYVSGIPCTDCSLAIMQSGIIRLVSYDGPSDSGHRGNGNQEFWEKYSFSSRIENIPLTGKFRSQKNPY